MCRNVAYRTFLLLLTCAVLITVLTSCDPDYREAGRRTGDLYSEVEGTVAAEVEERAPTVVAEVEERAPTVAAEIEERAPTVAAEVEERAPTVAAEAAEAARDFSEGVKETDACHGATAVLLGAGLIAAIVSRRRT